jgi:hypothetical protein
MLATGTSLDDEILLDLASLNKRPFDWVLWAFPWGEKDTELESRSGPDAWQAKCLFDIQTMLLAGHCDIHGAIEYAIKSGHGVGKSALVSWIVWWAISTAVDTRGRVTANTEKQLRTVLWAEIAKWHGLFIARHMFKSTATAIYSADPLHEKNWRIDAVPWSDENPEAFAGLHNFGKRLIYVFDEASAIVDKIWEVVDGAMTDAQTELIWLATGNPTRNFGRFHDCFNEGSGWFTLTVNSEDSAFSNKNQLALWEKNWGWDSDFYRVRVRGEFPNSSELQLIAAETIRSARKRPVISQTWEPLIFSIDIARFGNNESVAGFRRGKDARSIPVQRWRGLSTIETGTRICNLIAQHQPDATFIDEGGVGGGVVDFVRHLGYSCIGVNFGIPASTKPNGILVSNKRAEMYVGLNEWLREGGCIEDDNDLEEQLISIEYHFDKKQQIQLMSKEDMRSLGRPSPDWGDQIAMTFAFPVSALGTQHRQSLKADYDPLSFERLPSEVGPGPGLQLYDPRNPGGNARSYH